MRTTLTLDDDVAAALDRLRRSTDKPFKEVVNDALRLGLEVMDKEPKRGKRFETRAVDLGACRLNSLDNVAEVLALGEGDAYK